MDFSPTSNGCTRGIKCSSNITEECPSVLKAPGGCSDPCTVFKTDQYCCNSSSNCEPTDYSKFFKDRCPNAYSYPQDDQTSTFTCPAGVNYRVMFCPWRSLSLSLSLCNSKYMCETFERTMFDLELEESFEHINRIMVREFVESKSMHRGCGFDFRGWAF